MKIPRNQVIAVNQRPDRTASMAPLKVPMNRMGRMNVKAMSK
jgi:hypothetical protein